MSSTGFLECFGELPDPRLERQKRHPLVNVLLIAVSDVICGATGFVDMQDFGYAKLEWFAELLDLNNGIPSHDTFRRVFSLIDPQAFRSCFMAWTQAISVEVDGDIIAFDGKTLRLSFDAPFEFYEQDDWGHGRAENRKYWVVAVERLEWLSGKDEWLGLVSVACIDSRRATRGVESVERRYKAGVIQERKCATQDQQGRLG